MAPGVDLDQLADGDLRINRSGLQLGVPEQLLDKPDVRAALQHVRGAGVPQEMAGTALFQPGPFHPGRDHA